MSHAISTILLTLAFGVACNGSEWQPVECFSEASDPYLANPACVSATLLWHSLIETHNEGDVVFLGM